MLDLGMTQRTQSRQSHPAGNLITLYNNIGNHLNFICYLRGGVDNHGLGKTPTLLVYDIIKRKTDSKKWGQAAKDDIGDLKNSELLFDKFKLFLSRENSEGYYGGGHKELNQIYEKNNGYYGSTDSSKDDYNSINYGIVDAIADYLKYFKKHVDSAIMKEEKNGESKQKINYVLTVPAMWDASAREKMAKAAISAGIVTKEQISNLLIITEPEAAALYCENKYKDFVMEDGKTFIVCDAGGGTVDLVTFRLIKNSKGELSICQVGDGDGDFCGSTYLDEKFKDYLLKFYDDVGYQYDVCKLDFSDIMKKFETSWKVTLYLFDTTSIGNYENNTLY
jgi:molecular chaperone DnaK (HSP70)